MKVKHRHFQEFVRKLGGGSFSHNGRGDFYFLYPQGSSGAVRVTYYVDHPEGIITDHTISKVAKELAGVDWTHRRNHAGDVDFFKKALTGRIEQHEMRLEKMLTSSLVAVVAVLLSIPFFLAKFSSTSFSVLESSGVNPKGIFFALFVLAVFVVWLVRK